MKRPGAARAFGFVAAVAWLGELVFLVANARAFGSIIRSLWWTTRFLTDWSALLLAAVCTALALGWRSLSSPQWTGLATVAGVLVGLMFGLLGGWTTLSLRSLLGLSSVLAHVIAPWAMLIVWLFAADHGGLRWRDPPRFMLFPLAYLIQMFTRGMFGGGYPYPEVDVDRVGLAPALTFAGCVILLFFTLGLALVWADRLLTRSRAA